MLSPGTSLQKPAANISEKESWSLLKDGFNIAHGKKVETNVQSFSYKPEQFSSSHHLKNKNPAIPITKPHN